MSGALPRRAILAAALAAAPVPAPAQGAPGPWDGWALTGDAAVGGSHAGRPALRMRNGGATSRDANFRDGTIELDLAMTGERSFVYLRFRVTGEGEGEEIYFRPHKSSLPDAIQYAPAWNGESNWQLYHGEWGTAAAVLPREGWMHVRLVVQGRRAALYLGDTAAPALVVPLAREPAAGGVAVQAFTPAADAPAGEPVAAAAGIVIRHDIVPGHLPVPAAPRLPDGLVRRWQLSPAFSVDSAPVERLPEVAAADRGGWPAYPVEPHGVLVIGRHLRRPAPGAGVVARLVLRAERAGPQRLELGFSDHVTVFLNGRPVFAGDAHYSYDRPRQEGLIGLWQAGLWLPLGAGDNELLLVVSDGFGGWGLTARLDPGGGATVVTEP